MYQSIHMVPLATKQIYLINFDLEISSSLWYIHNTSFKIYNLIFFLIIKMTSHFNTHVILKVQILATEERIFSKTKLNITILLTMRVEFSSIWSLSSFISQHLTNELRIFKAKSWTTYDLTLQIQLFSLKIKLVFDKGFFQEFLTV